MKVELLGGPTGEHGSPRIYATDRNTFAVQGWPTDDPHQVEIPHRLLSWIPPGQCLSGLTDTGHGTFWLRGAPLTDPEALEHMRIPAHEIAVEVPVELEVNPDAPAARA